MANYVQFGLKPADAKGKAVTFHPQEGTQAQPDVVALALGPPHLTALDPAELLDAPVILLDPPGKIRVLQTRQRLHRQVTGRPMVRVSVFVDHPEHSDRPVTRQMNLSSLFRNVHRTQRLRRPEVHPDLAIGLQPPQPDPAQGADFLEVLQAAVPTVEADAPGLQPALFRLTQLLDKQVVLAETVVNLVVKAVVAGEVPVPVRPEQGQEVDAL